MQDLTLPTGRLIGYARVSTRDQQLGIQTSALQAAGCKPRDIYTDYGISGKLASRPGLDKALRRLQPGDTLVVWKLDRLGRSLQHLVNTISDLAARKVGFKSLTESIDSTTNGGKLIFHIFAALAEFERGLISERTEAGLVVAAANGKFPGRPRALTPEQRREARVMAAEGKPVAAVARILGVSRATIYRVLGEQSGAAA